MSRWVQLFLAALLVVALAMTSWRLWKIETSIVDFLPAGDDEELFEISKSLADSTLTRRMVLSLSLPAAKSESETIQARTAAAKTQVAEETQVAERDAAGSVNADSRRELTRWATQLADELARSPRVRSVRRGVDQHAERELFEIYFPRRYHLWSLDPETELPRALSDEALNQAAQRLRDGLAGPESPLVRRLAPSDPLQVFRALLTRLEARRPAQLEVYDGQFFSRDGSAILFVELADSPFAGAKQRELLADLTKAAAPLREQGIVLEASGVNRFSVATEAIVKSDLTRISMLSLGGLLLLFVVLFRSPARLLLAFAPVVMGVLIAVTVSLIVFGKLHVLALAFGSTLIGVAIDYPVHLLNHHDLAPAGAQPRATVRRLFPSLLLAGVTTSVGLLGWGLAGFPGLREMALFACAGILGALGTTLWLGSLMGAGGEATAMQRRVALLLARWARRRRPVVARVTLGLVIVVAAAGLSRLRWQDDLQALHQPDPRLVEEDGRVRAKIGEVGGLRFIVAQGGDLESALQRHERMVPRVDQLLRSGALGGYASVDTLLRSAALQERNVKVLRAQNELGKRTLAALDTAGFVADGFEPFLAELASMEKEGGAAPLTLAELMQTSLHPLVTPFVTEVVREQTTSAAVVTPLQDVARPDEVRQALSSLEGVHYFDQRHSLDTMYRDVRARTVRLVYVALGLMILVAMIRYRSWRRALSVVAPGWLGAALTIALLSFAGVQLNLLHVVALVLVLSMGIDYGIFLVDAEGSEAAPAALLSIVVACLSTVLAFGLLALSHMPALRSIGETVALGVMVNALLAPLMVTALARQPAGGTMEGAAS